MIRKAIDRYKAPTPLKFRVWGRVILGFGTVMQVGMQGMDAPKEWLMVVTLLTAVGTVLPEFAVLHESEAPEESTSEAEKES